MRTFLFSLPRCDRIVGIHRRHTPRALPALSPTVAAYGRRRRVCSVGPASHRYDVVYHSSALERGCGGGESIRFNPQPIPSTSIQSASVECPDTQLELECIVWTSYAVRAGRWPVVFTQWGGVGHIGRRRPASIGHCPIPILVLCDTK